MAKRHDNGADFWATPDRRISKGSPFSTLDCTRMLVELGVPASDPLLQGAIALIFSAWRTDGRFQVAPHAAIYPCQTIHCALTLCLAGHAADARLASTRAHLLANAYLGGGWRCNKFIYGRGPETEYCNPGPTLAALDLFRFTPQDGDSALLDAAVDALLAHWTIRRPLGPCQFGIGTRFLQVAYPFAAYNLFHYVYVLSHYARARQDGRFQAALQTLEAKLRDGKVVVERPNPQLAGFAFCKKGATSELATARYHEILRNLGRAAQTRL